MKNILNKLKQPLKLSLVSILTTIFLHTRTSACGSKNFGLPLKFIRTTCDCSEHIIPINFPNLGIDIAYHIIVWSVIIYLWKDAKETWAMMKKKSALSSSNQHMTKSSN